MQLHHCASRRLGILLAVIFIGGTALLPSVIFAQGDQPAPIEITGEVSAMTNTTLIVAGLTVDVSNIALDVNISIGTTVKVIGQVAPGGIVIAQSIVVVIVNNPEATPEATPEMTPEATDEPSPTPTPVAGVVIVVEGPVINIINNIITIYNFDIEVEPQHPILTIIDIGDIVRVEGAFNSGDIIIASAVSNITSVTVVNNSGGATVGLDGPVEAINGNILVVNGISTQLNPNDPLLQTVRVGDFVSVQGNFQGNGTNIVLVVVNVVIINNIVIDNNPRCWYHEPGMGMGMGMGMGHWHCDGMGMGMGMGMGNPGMGMGMGMGG